jgi:hypothetical protein
VVTVLLTVQRDVTLAQRMVRVSALMARMNVRPALIHVKHRPAQVDTAAMESFKLITKIVTEHAVVLRPAHFLALQTAQICNSFLSQEERSPWERLSSHKAGHNIQ